MKKIYILVCTIAVLCMAGCFEDDSTLGTTDVPQIEIAEMRDTSIVSYSGNILEVVPVVETGYAEESLSYAWYYYPTNNVDNEEWIDGFRRNKISEERDLYFEVNLPSGTYTIVFEVKSNENQFSVMQHFTLGVTTEFSSLYYVLKETADGNSELDLVSGTDMNADMVAKVHGASIPGSPIGLSYIYNQGYMTETGSAGAKAMYVFTDEDTRVYNTEDFAEIVTRNTLSYQEFPDGEMPCNAFCAFVLMMVTNEGFYYTQPYDEAMGYTSASRYGASTGAGGSRYVVAVGGGGVAYVYWSEQEHHLYQTDYNGSSPAALEYTMPVDVDEITLSCIGGGTNYIGGTETNWFLLENASGERWLYTFGASTSGVSIERVAASSHLANARIVVANGFSAPGIYAVDGNQLYLCYFEDDGNGVYDGDSETLVTLPGIGADETISYISNQYLNAEAAWLEGTFDFDNLIIGTQVGENYRLYIYGDKLNSLPGGIPQEAVDPVEGVGIVKSVRYAAPVTFGIFDYIMASSPIFPLCD